ncbi:MAG: hypothetical protein JXP34_22725, partial [Planctomycetes bacterium]|nr:hypothetical protein [Planctomycetota bacterium]
RAHAVSMRATRWVPPAGGGVDDFEGAIALSNDAADAWSAWVDRLEVVNRLPGTPASGWLDKTFRVRAWGLKQQARDGAIAPLVRWVRAREGRADPERLRSIERLFAGVALANRESIEERLIEPIGAAYRRPRADPLRVADLPRVDRAPALEARAEDWPGIPRIAAAPWVFRRRPEAPEIGKYDEPMPQFLIEPPPPHDLSIAWQGAWDAAGLYLRVAVRDDWHRQGAEPADLFERDAVRIALAPGRDDFTYPIHSWYFLWGGYRGDEVEVGVALGGEGEAAVRIFQAPKDLRGRDPRSLVTARAARRGEHTVYEVALDWGVIPSFTPSPERSLGIAILVGDIDKGEERRVAEYGGGLARGKRPTEFAAVRLAGRPEGR